MSDNANGASKRESNLNKMPPDMKESRFASTTDHNLGEENHYIKDSRYERRDMAPVINAATNTEFEEVILGK